MIPPPQTPDTTINQNPAAYSDPQGVCRLLRRTPTRPQAPGLDFGSLMETDDTPFSPQDWAMSDPSSSLDGPLAPELDPSPPFSSLTKRPPSDLRRISSAPEAQTGLSPGAVEGALSSCGGIMLQTSAQQSPSSSMNHQGSTIRLWGQVRRFRGSLLVSECRATLSKHLPILLKKQQTQPKNPTSAKSPKALLALRTGPGEPPLPIKRQSWAPDPTQRNGQTQVKSRR
jgi:hypothetical protein